MEKPQDMNELLFTGLVLSFQQSAMIGLGKIMNPVSGKIEKSLDQAKYSIDLLGMLQKKTAGNLTEAESAMLQQTLTMLRLNYVEEVKADSKRSKDEKPEATEPTAREGEEEEALEKKTEEISGEKEERSEQKPKTLKKKKSGKNEKES